MQIEQFGPYKIGKKLGRGGMGTVYAGENVETGELAAVKVLSAAMNLDEGFRERFISEIETLEKLRHPNIVRLLGEGEQDGLLFYAMELVDGKSLEEELHRCRKFEWRTVSQIGVKMAKALKHAHDHGVIHRDIKPANILIAANDEVKLSDFGIAKLFGSTGLTSDGGVLGTAEYMAPEQADGRPATYRSDLYSLGGVLYSLLAGRPPFRAKSIPEMLHMQRFAVPEPLRRYCHDCPDELASIVLQLLEKEPEKRIPNAMILARRLEAMEHGLLQRQAEEERAAASQSAALLAEESHVLRPISPSNLGPVSPVALTKGETDSLAQRSVALQVGDGGRLAETQFTGANGQDAAAVGFSIAPPPARTAATRFATVREQERDEKQSYREIVAALISPQTWLLVGALVVLGLGGWYLLLPPSKEKLYARITALAADENGEKLMEAEPDILAYLQYYSNDPAAREVERYRDEIDLLRMERKFELRARRMKNTENFTAVERAYADAMQQAKLDPQQGLKKLLALLAVYEEEADAGDRKRKDNISLCLRLARKQVAPLQRQADFQAEIDLKLIHDQLQRANDLAETDPAQAQAVWHGIVQLYDGKSWAQDAVDKARAQLSKHAAAPPTTASN